jgi:hypothetical protein
MLTVKGKVKNGRILPLEQIDEAFEGREVIIGFVEEKEVRSNGDDWQKLFHAIEENQFEGETTDLAHQHDFYLYRTDKRD